MVFPGTTGDRFCGYDGDNTGGNCDATSYILVVFFQLAFPGLIIGSILWLCLLVCVISYCCWKCRCPPMPEQKYQFLFGPWLEKGMYKLRLPRALVALFSILIILLSVAIVLTDISVNNSTRDFSDGTASFADQTLSNINQYKGQIDGLSQSIQNTVNAYRKGASDLKDNLDIVYTVQIIKFIIEVVVCAALVLASLAGLLAGVWPKRTLFLIVMIVSFLAVLPTFLLFSYDVAYEGVSKDLCSEMEDEADGDRSALSYGVLPCDDPTVKGTDDEEGSTVTGIPDLDNILTCQVVGDYSAKNKDHVCGGMMNSGVIGLLSLFLAIVLIFQFLTAFGTHGLIGLKKQEEKAEEEMKPRRGYVEGTHPQKKQGRGVVAKEGRHRPNTNQNTR